jgi:uncharacterized protein (TIGR02466 family)
MPPFLQNIFPTPLLIGHSTDLAVRSEIITRAYQLRAGLTRGNLVSEQWDLSGSSSDPQDFATHGVTSFNSTEWLNHLPEWDTVTAFIRDFAGSMISSVDGSPRLELQNLWTTIYPPGAFVPEHVHSHSTLSGVFYAKAEPQCGEIVFSDPAWVAKTMSGPQLKGRYPETATKFKIAPEPGLMVVFPAWLPHRTLPNQSGEDRIMVSFNMSMDRVE